MKQIGRMEVLPEDYLTPSINNTNSRITLGGIQVIFVNIIKLIENAASIAIPGMIA